MLISIFRFFFFTTNGQVMSWLEPSCMNDTLCCVSLYLQKLFIRHGFLEASFTKKLKVKKLSSSSKNSKLKNFLPKTQNSGNFFRNIRRFSFKYNYLCLKSGKIVQKLKNLPKTQGKISKNLKFPANPISSNAGKTSKKRACFW